MTAPRPAQLPRPCTCRPAPAPRSCPCPTGPPVQPAPLPNLLSSERASRRWCQEPGGEEGGGAGAEQVGRRSPGVLPDGEGLLHPQASSAHRGPGTRVLAGPLATWPHKRPLPQTLLAPPHCLPLSRQPPRTLRAPCARPGASWDSSQGLNRAPASATGAHRPLTPAGQPRQEAGTQPREARSGPSPSPSPGLSFPVRKCCWRPSGEGDAEAQPKPRGHQAAGRSPWSAQPSGRLHACGRWLTQCACQTGAGAMRRLPGLQPRPRL